MSTAPEGFKAVAAGDHWGIGPEPFPENVPSGDRYVDAFGNRAVVADDGTVLVEGLGVGVNAGKPDGQWWPYSGELAAGPTNAEPWAGDETAGSDPKEEGATPQTATAVSGVSAPVVLATEPPSPAALTPSQSAMATNSPAAVATASPSPVVSLHRDPHTGGLILRVEHLAGDVEHFVVRSFEQAWAKVESIYRAHFRAHPATK